MFSSKSESQSPGCNSELKISRRRVKKESVTAVPKLVCIWFYLVIKLQICSLFRRITTMPHIGITGGFSCSTHSAVIARIRSKPWPSINSSDGLLWSCVFFFLQLVFNSYPRPPCNSQTTGTDTHAFLRCIPEPHSRVALVERQPSCHSAWVDTNGYLELEKRVCLCESSVCTGRFF